MSLTPERRVQSRTSERDRTASSKGRARLPSPMARRYSGTLVATISGIATHLLCERIVTRTGRNRLSGSVRLRVEPRGKAASPNTSLFEDGRHIRKMNR